MPALGQPSRAVRTVGILSAGPDSVATAAEFRRSLGDHGWIEGKNIEFVHRYANDDPERLAAFAAELIGMNADVIYTVGTLAPLAARRLTSIVPIVMGSAGDPLGSGLVSNLARPGGNVTGLSMMVTDVGKKRLQLLKEIAPGISRTAIFWNAANPYPARVYRETRDAAKELGIDLQSLEIREPRDTATVFAQALQRRADSLLTVEDPLTIGLRKQIVEFTTLHRIPAMHGLRVFTEIGGLASYGVNLAVLQKRGADYVDRILKGAKPGDMPVEQPNEFELVINRVAAKSLGVTLPASILVRADQVL